MITQDIIITDDKLKVMFNKKMWHDSELILAKCYNFYIDVENGIIVATLTHTDKKALHDFIRISFKSFSESMAQEERRNNFYQEIEALYANIDQYVVNKVESTVPYSNKFYQHQWAGLRFAFFNRVVFIAFKMRLGKSIIAASLSRIFNYRRTLIVCPSVAKIGWFVDMTNPPDKKGWGFEQMWFTILDAAKSKTFYALDERFVVVNYDVLEKFMPYLMSERFDHIILDEAHKLKNTHSNRFLNVKKIVEHSNDPKITFLSGSMIPNRFNDLFAYFKLAKHHLGENYTKFCDEFTVKVASRGGDKIKGAKNIAELKIRMQNFAIVRTFEECFDMPDDIVSKLTFEFDDYKPEYDRIISEMASQKTLSSLNSSLHSLNILVSKSKIKGTIDILEDIIEENGKVVVFGGYNDPIAMLQDYFKERCVVVDGSCSANEKYALRTKFTEDPAVQVFIGNFQAAGEALDLSIASDIYTLNFPFTPRELEQALSRCKHPEKKGHTRIHYSFCQGSLDEYLFDLVANKSRDINALLHDGKEIIEMENLTEVLIKKLLNRDDIVFENFKHKAPVLPTGEEVQESSQIPQGQGIMAEIEKARIPSNVSIDNGRSVFVPNPLFVGDTEYTNERGVRNIDKQIQSENVSGESGGVGQAPTSKDGPEGATKYYYLTYDETSDGYSIMNEDQRCEMLNDSMASEVLSSNFRHEDVNEVIKVGRHKGILAKGGFNSDYIPNPTVKEVFLDMTTRTEYKGGPGKMIMDECGKVKPFSMPDFL